jgi:hypothetical protein
VLIPFNPSRESAGDFGELITTPRKTMTIKTILHRHHYGCFDVEDTEGNQYMIQLAHKLEEQWQQAQRDKKTMQEMNRIFDRIESLLERSAK